MQCKARWKASGKAKEYSYLEIPSACCNRNMLLPRHRTYPISVLMYTQLVMRCSLGYAKLRGSGELPNSSKTCGEPNCLKAGNFELFSFQTVDF